MRISYLRSQVKFILHLLSERIRIALRPLLLRLLPGAAVLAGLGVATLSTMVGCGLHQHLQTLGANAVRLKALGKAITVALHQSLHGFAFNGYLHAKDIVDRSK